MRIIGVALTSVEMTMERVCPKGHVSTDPDYCSECGAKLDGAPSAITPATAIAPEELAAAAGGPANVTAYCTATAHTATPPSSHPAPTPSQHSGEPTSLPTPHGSGKPTALPTPHGSGKPTALPTPHGSGEPTGQPAPRRAEMLAQQERSAPPVTLRR